MTQTITGVFLYWFKFGFYGPYGMIGFVCGVLFWAIPISIVLLVADCIRYSRKIKRIMARGR